MGELFNMLSASQIGDPDVRPCTENQRVREGPEMPPQEALRESLLLECVLDTFTTYPLYLEPPIVSRLIELILNLLVYSAYELMIMFEDTEVISKRKKMLEDMKNRVENARSRQWSGHGDIGSSVSSELPQWNWEWDGFDTGGNDVTESVVDEWQSVLLDYESKLSGISDFRLHEDKSDIGSGTELNESNFFPPADESNDAPPFDGGKSTIDSQTYKNVHNDGRLGTPLQHQLDPERLRTMKRRHQDFSAKVELAKSRARRELFEIYRVIHDPLYDSLDLKLHYLSSNVSTAVAASVVLNYIQLTVLDNSDDPLLSLTSSVLTVLCHIAIRHKKKHALVVTFLKRCFESEATLPDPEHKQLAAADFQEKRAHTRRRILDFCMWLVGAGSYVPVMAFLANHVSFLDRTVVRAQLETIFELCKPPYSAEFCEAFLGLLHAAADEGVFTSKPSSVGIKFSCDAFMKSVWKSYVPYRIPSKVDNLMKRIRDQVFN
eukprot:GHVO01005964.1.p1 GENE.GHVO01005964.1~~GHVO01005964.1.p1  ORF type:complete len:491 (-),score=76.39 GHVO01005964.1:98-1570(-)